MSKSTELLWLDVPEDHDYPAALSYLRLTYSDKEGARLVESLKSADMTTFKAKDIYRASGLPLLGISNTHVEKNTKKIQSGTKLSPLLLVRDDKARRVIIADGYHRMCSVYAINEDADIPCKII